MEYWPEGVPKAFSYPEIPVHGIISGAARGFGQKKAVVHGGRELTYQELDRASSQLANVLWEMKPQKGARTLIFLPNSMEFIMAYYGVLKAGGIVVAASPMAKEMELSSLINTLGIETVVFQDELYQVLSNVMPQANINNLISVGSTEIPGALPFEEILVKRPPTVPDIQIEPKEDVAAIQCTGGTTGAAKHVMLTHYNLVSNAIVNALWFKWTEAERVMGLTPFYHTWGPTVCINSVFHVGATVYIMQQFDAEQCMEMIERHRLTIFYAVTSLWQMLINHPSFNRYDFSSLRYVKAGGMPVLTEVQESWERLTGVPMIPGYGLTEASPEAVTNPPQRVKRDAIGIPIIDTDARIVDVESGRDQPANREGELLIKGPQVMKGYWGDPDASSRTLVGGWLHTGDIMFMDEEGYLHFVERARDMIKYKGHGVFPAELEDILTQHPAVKECAVVGRPEPLTGEIPVAFVVTKEGTSVTEDELMEFCRERIAPYKRIRDVRFVKEIPKTPVGKILKRKLREMLQENKRT
jgi:long-chain acyl-CoA synthetase